MFCKYCGKIIDEDSNFCQYCGRIQMNERTMSNDIQTNQEHILNINGNINFSDKESLLTWILQFGSKYKSILLGYLVWFLLNLILLICGSDENGFFPRIFKDYHWWHEYKFPTTPEGYEKYSWAIEWKIEQYGWVEFIFYIALLPLFIYFGFILYKKIKILYIQYQIKNPNKPVYMDGLRRD